MCQGTFDSTNRSQKKKCNARCIGWVCAPAEISEDYCYSENAHSVCAFLPFHAFPAVGMSDCSEITVLCACSADVTHISSLTRVVTLLLL